MTQAVGMADAVHVREQPPTWEEIRRWDLDHVWHPFTPMAEYAAGNPPVFTGGRGHYLTDDQGRRYLDGTSAMWCNLFGYRVPELDAAVSAQLHRLAHSTLQGATHPPAAELAHRLAALAPSGLTRVFFSGDGATAIEAALKIAFQYRLRTKGHRAARTAVYVSLSSAYHADTLTAAGVGGVALFHGLFRPFLFPTQKVHAPYCYRCPLGKQRQACDLECTGLVEQALQEAQGAACAVILEPAVQAAAGMLMVPEGYLPRVADACHRHGALLILDEIVTGFGRTGRLFACQREGVTPDILCLGKGLTGGYLPLAATLTSEPIYRQFLGRQDEYTLFHGHTYTGNPLACAAALATLGLLADGRLIGDVDRKATVLRKHLEPIARHPRVGDIRQAGLMCGVELVADRNTRAMLPATERTGQRVCDVLRKRGFYLHPIGDVIPIVPPLTVTDEQLQALAAALGESVADVCRA